MRDESVIHNPITVKQDDKHALQCSTVFFIFHGNFACLSLENYLHIFSADEESSPKASHNMSIVSEAVSLCLK
jgi:hypothetical protein